MDDKKKKNSKILLFTLIILFIIISVFYISYSIFSYFTDSTTKELVVGDIYMHYNEGGKELSMTNIIPSDGSSLTDYFEFHISGKNTSSKNIVYNVKIAKGNTITNKTRIEDSLLKFRLVEVINNQENILFDNRSFSEINNTIVYTSMIEKNTNEEKYKTYRLYMWISNSLKVGNTSDAYYTVEEWNNLYASIKVNVNGDFNEPINLASKIVNNIGTDGIVGVNTNGELYDGEGEIREVRYSGTNNYCTYTNGTTEYNMNVDSNICPEKACYVSGSILSLDSDYLILQGSTCSAANTLTLVENNVHETTLKNYIKFNDELWRILGVVNGKLKIIRNESLPNSIYSEETFTSSENKLYTLKYMTGDTNNSFFIFNTQESYPGTLSYWIGSSIQVYLNDEKGYYGTIDEKYRELISEETYYLGNVTVSSKLKDVYNQERGNIICDSTITTNSHNNSCNVWYENKPTWYGKIGLAYVSDVGYAAASDDWGKSLTTNYPNGITGDNWIYNSIAQGSWLISPASSNKNQIIGWRYTGKLQNGAAGNAAAIRPVLYLTENAEILYGDGSYNNPYVLSLD